MKDLLATLQDYDPGMLPALAATWGMASKSRVDISQLKRSMLDPGTAEAAWDKLDDSARAAMQLLVSSERQRMKIAQFERFYGKVRKLGRAQIEKEQPYSQGQSIAETLYYRGFIGEAYDKVADNLIGFYYVPTDLAAALPLHKTSYEQIDAPDAPDLPYFERERETLATIEPVQEVISADTSIIDDLTTLLARLQIYQVELEAGALPKADVEALLPQLLHDSGIRLDFLLALGTSAG